ncbi:Hypothetical predicted protein [Cloeon dipterum]|uniref:Uncharacterized protein n=1 Tax=Cloeon dipterum TaxID=197152 RepID=A0A8S1DXD1_9INSE|nr:Hypothetical predicted protein [Cloeon dipterum]
MSDCEYEEMIDDYEYNEEDSSDVLLRSSTDQAESVESTDNEETDSESDAEDPSPADPSESTLQEPLIQVRDETNNQVPPDHDCKDDDDDNPTVFSTYGQVAPSNPLGHNFNPIQPLCQLHQIPNCELCFNLHIAHMGQ